MKIIPPHSDSMTLNQNKYYEKDLPRRGRFYQSIIDSKFLPSKSPYQHLPDMITIWILPYDPFGDNRMIYTVKKYSGGKS